MLPHETTSFPEAFCCRALLRCWSLPIPWNWNTRSAWLKSRTRAGGFSGFFVASEDHQFLNCFLILQIFLWPSCDHATVPELASGTQPSPKLEDTGGAETNLRELPREFHHSIIWKAMENQHNQSMLGAREAAGFKSLHQMLHEGWSSNHQAQQSWSLVMKIFFVFFSRLICSMGLAQFWREHDSMMCCIWCRWGA